ncbi:MAG: hypothetical protein JST45_09175 [Bacteroidetes bacterium]|nr:hypothetical protein [Bacteroidota bacterium]
MHTHSLLLVPIFCLAGASFAQTPQVWQPELLSPAPRNGRYIVPDRALGYSLDVGALRQQLSVAAQGSIQQLPAAQSLVSLPLPNGSSQQFRFLETPVMQAEMAVRYPQVRTYTGVAVGDPRVRVKFDLTPAGFHAMVTGLPQGDAFIDPVSMGNNVVHQAYWKKDLVHRAGGEAMTCGYDAVNDVPHAMQQTAQWLVQAGSNRAGDCQFRTYRLALACTGEYANFFGATGTNKAPAVAAMATTLNRVNGVYERDAALTMVLVGNDDQLVFTDPATDGYTNDDGGTMLDENQAKCDAVIGSANYDIGHVFSTGGGGVAYLNSPCTDYKAGGVTGLDAPVGDPFDIDYVAHEMGHQYGGNHTQNNSCNRAYPASVEVGSGITIMGYAGVCSPNVAPHSIAMFGGYSLEEIHANITEGNSSTCPVTVPLVNAPPTVNAGSNYTIPMGTPFVLTATGADADQQDSLTYSWEQMDAQPSTQPPVATSNNGPNFRPWLPSASPQRWVPQLPTVLSGGNPSPNWEVLSTVARNYHFRVTVRDNATGGGCNAQDDMQVNVSGSTGPFVVTQPNTAVSWTANSSRNITWDPAGTAGAPVNCANVDILLSTDGGLTWPYTLAGATANDGTESVILPNATTTEARVMVRANGNIFYDVGDVDFSIVAPAQLLLNVKLWLEGPNAADGLMNDNLRSAGLLPQGEPYTGLGFVQAGNGGGESCGAAVLAATGPDAIVDWVRIELRSAGSPANVLYTRQALLQRDGDVVDMDGISPVAFEAPAGTYYIAARHRNHLGCMTAAAVTFGASATTVDFTAAATATYGTEARKPLDGKMMLWAGNALPDSKLAYTGAQNDRDVIINLLGGLDPTDTVAGYFTADVTMNGVVQYTGVGNDRDPILPNLQGNLPTSLRLEQLP